MTIHNYAGKDFNIDNIFKKEPWECPLIELAALADYNTKWLKNNEWYQSHTGFYHHKNYINYWFDMNSLVIILMHKNEVLKTFLNIHNAIEYLNQIKK